MTKTLIERVIVAVYEANSYGSSLSDDEAEAAIRAVLQEMIAEIRKPKEENNYAVYTHGFIMEFAKENGIEV